MVMKRLISDFKLRKKLDRERRLEQLRQGNRGPKGGPHRGSKAEKNKKAARRANRNTW
jgi:hypothetical protein